MPRHKCFSFPGTRLRPLALAGMTSLLAIALSGCTSRGMTITSVPPGAEVSVNRRVIGQTPVRVNYSHYGTYRIEMRKDRYETFVKEEKINPPWYGYDPLTFVADNLIPARFNDEISLHYVMKPVQDIERGELMARAAQARQGKVLNPRTGKELSVDVPPPANPEGKDAPPEAPGTDGSAPGKEPAKSPEKEKEPSRTPKGEILIYEESPPKEPGKKDEPKDAKPEK